MPETCTPEWSNKFRESFVPNGFPLRLIHPAKPVIALAQLNMQTYFDAITYAPKVGSLIQTEWNRELTFVSKQEMKVFLFWTGMGPILWI
jgi:hypothetical protein